MKNFVAKFLFLFLILVGFYFPKTSFASVIMQQTDGSSQDTTYRTLYGSGPYIYQSLGTGISGNLSTLQMMLNFNYPADPVDRNNIEGVEVIQCDDASMRPFEPCPGHTNWASDYLDVGQYVGYPALITFHFSGNHVFNPSKYYWIVLPQPYASVMVFGSASNTYPNGQCFYYSYGDHPCTNIADLYFVFDNGVVAPSGMIIDTPANSSFLSTASKTTISGKCLNPGSGQLELSYSPFLARLDPSSAFNIDCSSSYTFSTTFTPKDGNNTVWIIDKSVQGENPPNIFNTQRYVSVQYTGYAGSSSGLDWFLSIEYPPDNGSHIFKVNPNTQQQFRFRFRVPDDSLKATSRIKYIQWVGSTRFTASTTIEFIGLDSLDLDGDGLLGMNADPLPDGQSAYYTVYLENGTTTMYDIPFTITADSAAQTAGTTVNPNAPDDRQYGPCLNLPLIGLNNFCLGTAFYALVIPNPRYYKDDVNDTYQLMQNKIPFAFYYQLKDQLSGVAATSTDFTYNIPVTLASSTHISLTIPFSSNNSGVHSVRSTLDPWFKAFAWFSFAWWAYRKSTTFKF